MELEYPLLDLFISQKVSREKQPVHAALSECTRGVINGTFQAAIGDYNTIVWHAKMNSNGGDALFVTAPLTFNPFSFVYRFDDPLQDVLDPIILGLNALQAAASETHMLMQRRAPAPDP